MTDTAEAPPVAPPWTIRWRGKGPWTQDQMTFQHLAALTIITGRDDWDMIDVRPGDSPMALGALIAAHLVVESSEGIASDDDVAMADAVAQSWDEVRKATVREITESISFD